MQPPLTARAKTLIFEVGPRSYAGGSLKAQGFILLHELGHGISIARESLSEPQRRPNYRMPLPPRYRLAWSFWI